MLLKRNIETLSRRSRHPTRVLARHNEGPKLIPKWQLFYAFLMVQTRHKAQAHNILRQQLDVYVPEYIPEYVPKYVTSHFAGEAKV